MSQATTPRQALLNRVVDFAAANGIAGKSLRDIAAGTGTSHRMLIYHFGSREGLLAAIVSQIEARQAIALASLSEEATTPVELMRTHWTQLTDPSLRPFARLFFEMVGQALAGAPGTEGLLASLTTPWIEVGADAADRLGATPDRAGIRLSVAVSRGLLLDLLAGADLAEVDAAYAIFLDLVSARSGSID